MAKLILDDLVTLTNETSAVATINNNNADIEAALENTLSRDGTTPNQMEADFDMNSNRILNLPSPASNTEPVTKGYADNSYGNSAEAVAAAAAAAAFQTAAETAQTGAETARDEAVAAAASLTFTVIPKSTSFTVLNTDDGNVFHVDATSGPITITLDDSSNFVVSGDTTDDFRCAVVRTAGTNTITVVPSGTDTISGETTLSTSYKMLNITLDQPGSNWVNTSTEIKDSSITTAKIADTAVTSAKLNSDVFSSDHAWTGIQSHAFVTDNDGSFDTSAGHNFKCTPTGNTTLAFTSLTNGQAGVVVLDNSGAYTITDTAVTWIGAAPSWSGTTVFSWVTDGTTVYGSGGSTV